MRNVNPKIDTKKCCCQNGKAKEVPASFGRKEAGMKEKYTIEQDGFVGYWHPAEGDDGMALIVRGKMKLPRENKNMSFTDNFGNPQGLLGRMMLVIVNI